MLLPVHIAKTFLVHRNSNTTSNKGRGVLRSKKVAFVFIDSFLSLHVQNISYLISKNYVKKIEQNIEISIFMYVLLILQHLLHCFSFVGLK